MSTDTRPETIATARPAEATCLVDCDMHLGPARPSDVLEFLPQRWRDHLANFGRGRVAPAFYPRRSEYGERFDSWPPSGLAPGCDFDFLRSHHLDAWGIDYAVITPGAHPGSIRNQELSAAMARAQNEWQAEAVSRDDRLRASLLVATENPDAAVEEIERWAHDGRFVQVYLYSGMNEPLGRRKYWRMIEATERSGLPLAIHFGGATGSPPTSSGFPSYYVEEHAGVATAFQDHVASLVFEGVFQRFPRLRLVLIEGGFGWLAPLMWRMDYAWQRLGGEVPNSDRLPSEVIAEHVWYTTQPMEEPATDDDFVALLEQLGGHTRLMFATDYPHWDFDAPDHALPVRLDPTAKRAIFGENARALYRLPEPS
jgi:predicted TIM-barrel fold metal-dependent hydrolase